MIVGFHTNEEEHWVADLIARQVSGPREGAAPGVDMEEVNRVWMRLLKVGSPPGPAP